MIQLIKKVSGKGQRNSDCCGVEIKEVQEEKNDSCCGSDDADSCCGSDNDQGCC
ncbi:hypothetical protein ACJROX_23390 [Pseudalkalibacillus sp. A8]|uniref:hypothetical protein n=1 Tax=Pseudalkalibacillus sp. A8 TaxID=3382641 RepID=UPI0038B5482C